LSVVWIVAAEDPAVMVLFAVPEAAGNDAVVNVPVRLLVPK
jgi:hypothetical protein